jgi:hypothetical protein
MEKLYRGPYIDAYCLPSLVPFGQVVSKMAAVFKGNDYLPLKFASVSFYCQVSDTGSVG